MVISKIMLNRAMGNRAAINVLKKALAYKSNIKLKRAGHAETTSNLQV